MGFRGTARVAETGRRQGTFRRACSAAAGFTLIEVLIALMVLAVGVVGAAGTQLAALRTRHGSTLMSDGVQLAIGLADRMRANPAQMRLDDARNPYAVLDYDAGLGAPPASGVACLAGTGCSSAELAAFDLAEIQQALASGFPGGRLLVCRDSTVLAADGTLAWTCGSGAGAPLVIKLGWRGKQADGADDTNAAGELAPALVIVVAGAYS